MINKITEAGGSARLAEAVFNVLRIALNKAFAEEIITKLPFKTVSLPKKIKQEFVPLSQAEWLRLFAAAEECPEIYTALSVMWATGISRSELLALTWQDVNFENATILIHQAAIITSDGVRLNNPKAETRRRLLPIPDMTVAELQKHKTRQAAIRLAAAIWDKNNLLFPTNEGQLQDPRNWSKKFTRVVKSSGVAVTSHKLRHDHASRLAENGVSIKDAQYRLGHSAFGCYTHRMTGGQEQIAAMLAKTFPVSQEKDAHINKS